MQPVPGAEASLSRRHPTDGSRSTAPTRYFAVVIGPNTE
ncbi:hypothetical protein I552_3554 [Mycobacterium xenopi 3993]|nr:hypothetical protein I552_3554 [Mycobacterium xenopi 3993]